MNIKKITGKLLICILLLNLFIVSAHADPSVLVSSYDWEPEVFMPGDEGTITLTISNAEASHTITSVSTVGGTQTTRTDSVGVFFEKINFLADSDGTNDFRAIESYTDLLYLAPASSFEITLPVVAEDGLREGTYFPLLLIDVQSYDDLRMPLPIEVKQGTIRILTSSLPQSISDTGSTQLTLSLVSEHEGTLNSIKITPQPVSGLIFSPSTVIVDSLAPYSSEEVLFSVRPESKGTYIIGFNLSFLNGKNEHTSSVNHTLTVDDTIDIAPILYEIPSSIMKGETKKLRLKVYNAKSEAVSGVVVTPQTTLKVTPSEYFIGSIAANDEFAVSFEVDTSDASVGHHTIDFDVRFMQEQQQYSTDPISASFSITEEEEGDNGAMAAGAIVVLLIVIGVIGYIWYRRRSG